MFELLTLALIIGGGLATGIAIARRVPGAVADPAADRTRIFRRTRLRAIGEVTSGPLKVAGRVERVERMLSSPLTGRPCIAWEVSVRWSKGDEQRGLGARWAGCGRFHIRDEAGVALVETGDAPVLFGAEEIRMIAGRYGEYAERVRAFLAAHGWGGEDKEKYLELAERRIDDQRVVTVVGLARVEADPGGEGTYRVPATRIVISPIGHGVLLSDETARMIETVT